MSTLHAPASVFPFQTPARLGAFAPSTGCTTTAPNAAHEFIDADTAAEMNAWHDDVHAVPTGDELDDLYDQYRVELGATDGAETFFADFIDRLEPQFPEVVTWPDDQLVLALDMADRREPGLNLHPVGDVPDRHAAFVSEVSAEILRHLDARDAAPVALAA